LTLANCKSKILDEFLGHQQHFQLYIITIHFFLGYSTDVLLLTLLLHITAACFCTLPVATVALRPADISYP
jgi:hypothetical protein